MNLLNNNGKPEKDITNEQEAEYRFTVDAGQNPSAETSATQKRSWLIGVFLSLLMVVGFVSLISDAIGRMAANNTSEKSTSAYVIGNTGGNLTIVDAPDNMQDIQNLSYREVVQNVSPSIVSVTIYKEGILPSSSASGIIISANGLIVTSANAIEDAEMLTVTLQDGTRYTAQVVGKDLYTDIAVIRISASNLLAATFANSSYISAGEQVIIIGSTQGAYSTIEWALVASAGKPVPIGNGTQYMELIQVGIDVNAENSGGALVNMQGQVVGICSTSIANENRAGIGVAIPFSEARPIIDELVEYGRMQQRASVHARVIAMNKTIGVVNGMPEQGLYITELMENSPLRSVNIEAGQILLRADGQDLVTEMDLMQVLSNHKPGDFIQFVVYNPSTGRTGMVECALAQA